MGLLGCGKNRDHMHKQTDTFDLVLLKQLVYYTVKDLFDDYISGIRLRLFTKMKLFLSNHQCLCVCVSVCVSDRLSVSVPH
jgi:hypothetical protein